MQTWAVIYTKKDYDYPVKAKEVALEYYIAYRSAHSTFFVFGFMKSERANINRDELVALKELAKNLLSHADVKINQLLKARDIVEVTNE